MAGDPDPLVIQHRHGIDGPFIVSFPMNSMVDLSIVMGQFTYSSYGTWPMEINGLPMKNGGSFHSYFGEFTRG